MDEYFDREGKPLELMEWAKKFNDNAYKRVAADELEGLAFVDSEGKDVTLKAPVRVSTVWLGLNHRWGEGDPLIFETMIFGGPHDQWQDRYSTEQQAKDGHARVVAALRAGR